MCSGPQRFGRRSPSSTARVCSGEVHLTGVFAALWWETEESCEAPDREDTSTTTSSSSGETGRLNVFSDVWKSSVAFSIKLRPLVSVDRVRILLHCVGSSRTWFCWTSTCVDVSVISVSLLMTPSCVSHHVHKLNH